MSRTGIRKVLSAAGLVTAMALAGPIASASACKGAGLGPSQLNPAQAQTTIICLMNQRRAKHGAPRLRYDAHLERAAQGHSTAMDAQNVFSHEGDGSPLSRITGTGYLSGARSWGIGENLYWGTGGAGSARATVAGWMASPEHRTIMLSRSFRQVGIGVIVGGSPDGDGGADATIFTADFGYRH